MVGFEPPSGEEIYSSTSGTVFRLLSADDIELHAKVIL